MLLHHRVNASKRIIIVSLLQQVATSLSALLPDIQDVNGSKATFHKVCSQGICLHPNATGLAWPICQRQSRESYMPTYGSSCGEGHSVPTYIQYRGGLGRAALHKMSTWTREPWSGKRALSFMIAVSATLRADSCRFRTPSSRPKISSGLAIKFCSPSNNCFPLTTNSPYSPAQVHGATLKATGTVLYV